MVGLFNAKPIFKDDVSVWKLFILDRNTLNDISASDF